MPRKPNWTQPRKRSTREITKPPLTQAQKGQQMLDETSKPDMVAKAMYLVGLSKLQLAGDNREMIDQALEELNALAEYEKGQNFAARDNATKKTVYFDSQKELDARHRFRHVQQAESDQPNGDLYAADADHGG